MNPFFPPYYLGVDVGTTSTKAGLFDSLGEMVAFGVQEYHLETPGQTMVEIDANQYWQACCMAIRQAVASSELIPDQIAALSISSQGETLIPVDRLGSPLRKALVWLDNRAQSEAKQLEDQFSRETLYRISGQPVINPTWSACKLLWLKNHEPDTFSIARKFLLVEDFLIYHMTGESIASLALHTSTLWVDIHQNQWWQPMLDYLSLKPERLGSLVLPGKIVGSLRPSAADELGLSPTTKVVAGGMDQVVSALGAGNIREGIITETTGAAIAITATVSRPVITSQTCLPCHIHVVPEKYALLPWGQTAGLAVRWLRDIVSDPGLFLEGHPISYEWMDHCAKSVPPGSLGLIALPHLEGAMSPDYNPSARGVFFGITLRHTLAHFIRALYEAVAYLLKNNAEILERAGYPVREIYSLGGGARSQLWRQIKADVLQKPIHTLHGEEAGCRGAAMLAATGTGYFSHLSEAASCWIKIKDSLLPNQANRQVYEQGYFTYLALYERLKPLFS
jgi:xylulokinase